MGLLDRLRNNRQQSVLPDEVKQYYESEKRQRRGVAIGLALVALLVTILVAAALFFGGRFIYRQIKGDNNRGQTSSTSTTKSNTPAKSTENNGSGTTPAQPSTPPATTPAPTPAPSPTPTPTPAPAPSTTTPALGDTPALPHTGDEGL
jgi:type IV secretory pathway VirB10-like protein